MFGASGGAGTPFLLLVRIFFNAAFVLSSLEKIKHMRWSLVKHLVWNRAGEMRIEPSLRSAPRFLCPQAKNQYPSCVEQIYSCVLCATPSHINKKLLKGKEFVVRMQSL